MTTSAVLAALFIGSFFHVNLGPEIKAPVAYDMPPAYVSTLSADTETSCDKAMAIKPDTAWWTFFNEPVLNKCIDEAFQKNRDLETALARVQQARSVFKENRANQRPNLGLQADVTRSKILGNADGSVNETNVWYGMGVANYEADLWGRLQKATRAAKENILATEAAKNSVRLALASQVAKTYFSLRGTDKQLITARSTLDAQLKIVELSRILYTHGKTSELELKRNEATAASTAAQASQLEISMAQYENILLLLLGREPKDFVSREIPRGLTIDELPEPPVIPAGLPAELLKQRPDIKQAEQNYKVALANIGAARAGQYPTLSFQGLVGTPSDGWDTLFTGPTGWSIAAEAFAPIYNAGKLSSKTRQAEAVAQQAWSSYYKTVQVAFKETMDAIVAKDKTAEILKYTEEQETAQKRAYELAEARYSEGLTSQLDLLDAERELLSVQLKLDGIKADRLNSIVDFCTALGGGWAYTAEGDMEHKELQKPWINPAKFSE